MEPKASFCLEEIAQSCGTTLKRATEPLHVYQAFGIVSATDEQFQFLYNGPEGIISHLRIIHYHFSNVRNDLERYRHEDRPSEAQRQWFRGLCTTICRDLKLPEPRKTQQTRDTLIMQALRFLVLNDWLGECEPDRTELMISMATDSKGRIRTKILNACRPVCYGAFLFDIIGQRKAKCRWRGDRLQRALARTPQKASENLKRPAPSAILTTNKKMRVQSQFPGVSQDAMILQRPAPSYSGQSQFGLWESGSDIDAWSISVSGLWESGSDPEDFFY